MIGGMMGGTGFGTFGTFGLIGAILNLVITVGVIVGIALLAIWVVRRLGQNGVGLSAVSSAPSEAVSPREILQLRYAQGEITREQYQDMLADLS